MLREPNPSNLAPYSPLPDRHIPGDFAAQSAQDVLSVREIYGVEMAKAKKGESSAAFQNLIAAKGVVVGAILGIAQAEIKNGYDATGDTNLLATLAKMPVDWKSVATAGAVFGVTNAARRTSRPYTVGADIDKAKKQVETGGELVPHTHESYKRFRRFRTMRDLGLTALATGVAYEGGTQLTVAQNFALGIGLTTASIARVGVARHKYKKRGY